MDNTTVHTYGMYDPTYLADAKYDGDGIDESQQERIDELIAAMLKENTWFDFYGNENCDDDCCGWDGQSRRCQCGNRRVDWAYDGFGQVYPEPY